MNAAKSVTATFTLRTYTITATAGTGGSISPSGTVSVNYGANQAFTITANTGYGITSVLVDGASVGAVATYTFSNVTANHTISASFTANTYTLSATNAGTGTGTITSSPAGISCGSVCSYALQFRHCCNPYCHTRCKLNLCRLVRGMLRHRDVFGDDECR